jgi:hypothetical protein
MIRVLLFQFILFLCVCIQLVANDTNVAIGPFGLNEVKIIDAAKDVVHEHYKVKKDWLKLRVMTYNEILDPSSIGYNDPKLEVSLFDISTLKLDRGATFFTVKLSVNEFPKLLSKRTSTHQKGSSIVKSLKEFPLRGEEKGDLIQIKSGKIVEAGYTWSGDPSPLIPVKGDVWPSFLQYTVHGDGRVNNAGDARYFQVYHIILKSAVIKRHRDDTFRMGGKSILVEIAAVDLTMTGLYGYNWTVFFPELRKPEYEALVDRAKIDATAAPQ